MKTPNFDRLAERTVKFNNFYGGSMPCMPARRELHTGRYNFLHRSWGPLEPFDVSMPEMLKKNGIYTHLVTDHYHYFEDGGATYHGRYSSWELARGQEGDPWKAELGNVEIPEYVETIAKKPSFRQNWINRSYQEDEKDQAITVTFESGLEFIETNIGQDSWFLQIETFDPHEPFVCPEEYKALYPHEYDGKMCDWPPYSPVMESDEVVEHANYEYAALVSMCDRNLGKVLDAFDRYNMWEDTMLIVNTDHGFLLGEHQWWGKNLQPFYNEVINTPFFIWDPRCGNKNECRESLAQTIDIAPTLLEYFGLEIPSSMEGRSMRPVIENDTVIRETALFGIHGGHVNITDGKRTYMRGATSPENGPLYEYTLMPTVMRDFFKENQLKRSEPCDGFEFTEGIPVLKIPTKAMLPLYRFGHRLYDVQADWEQEIQLDDLKIEAEMIEKLRKAMLDSEAPDEQFERIGIERDQVMTEEMLLAQREEEANHECIDLGDGMEFEGNSRIQLLFLMDMIPAEHHGKVKQLLLTHVKDKTVNSDSVRKTADTFLADFGKLRKFFLHMIMNIHRGL